MIAGDSLFLATLVWGAPQWRLPVAVLGVLGALAVALSTRRLLAERRPLRALAAAALKSAGILALLLCLLEPMRVSLRARPAANHLLVLADTSRSLTVKDGASGAPRGDALRPALEGDPAWLVRAGQDFEVEHYSFDSALRNAANFDGLRFEGTESRLGAALERVARRASREPVAAVVLFSDGNATDSVPPELLEPGRLPPIFPVLLGSTASLRDVALDRPSVTESVFEEAPLTVSAEVCCLGCAGQVVDVELCDESGNPLGRETVTAGADDASVPVRFQTTTEAGLHFLSLRARLRDDPEGAGEATLDNNLRHVVVHRAAGPYRVLYVSGRPNWEFKFLRRAIAEDREVELVGLLRIAKRQPRFTFRPKAEDRRNTLFGGFEAREEELEQYDEPVLVRLGTRDEFELREGFPKRAEDLFEYSAVIVDDLEGGFFDADQKTTLEQFVSRRGGGFLMLGGPESFAADSYDRTPIGDLLPVYLDPARNAEPAPRLRLLLTREGWLEPWVRLRATESEEEIRRAKVPKLHTLNQVAGPKPGASVLLEAQFEDGRTAPALVAQRFGRGRSAALLVGDLWRWDLGREDPAQSDLSRAWRQMLRWLVADVPRRLELSLERDERGTGVGVQIRLRDERFEPADRARLSLTVQPQSGVAFELDHRPSSTEAGTWETHFTAREPGPHRLRIVATLPDGTELPAVERGFVAEPAAEELRTLVPDRRAMEELARATGGSLVEASSLEAFAEDLVHRDVPVQDAEFDPIWHRWWSFAFALGCLCAEWMLRRRAGWA